VAPARGPSNFSEIKPESTAPELDPFWDRRAPHRSLRASLTSLTPSILPQFRARRFRSGPRFSFSVLVIGVVVAPLVIGAGLWTLIGTNSDKGAAALAEIVSHASTSEQLSRPRRYEPSRAARRRHHSG
jgi:hypothetical protein